MAQRLITQLVDDLDGKELKDDQGETGTFGLDGVTYEIDLSAKNATSIRNALQQFIDVARKSGNGRSGSTRGRSWSHMEGDYPLRPLAKVLAPSGMDSRAR